MDTNNPLITAEHIIKKYPLSDKRGEFMVLDDISVQVHPAEVVALLGRSGCGKSTLLRILAGLIAPSSGVVSDRGTPLSGTNPGVAMVFQSYALFPWLTVQENVELGLVALGVEREERQTRALKAIDMVGLDGFESAYPKELSGGSKQRVGFARAFVVQPQVLLMDEPFSGLDVLTAENLRGEIADLWEAGTFPAKSILMVTHNIEEAVMLADRAIILTINPGRVRVEIPIDLPRPRQRDARFKLLVDEIYTIMTNPEAAAIPAIPAREEAIPRLPDVHTGEVGGLLQMLLEAGGKLDIPLLADHFQLEVDDLLPILDAATLLQFAEVQGGDVTITPLGQQFAESDIEAGKAVFRGQVLTNVPLVQRIHEALSAANKGAIRSSYFLELLEAHYTEGEAERLLDTAIAWGRYAELYEYDDRDEVIHLPR